MKFNKLSKDVRLYKLGIVGVAFIGQMLCVYRAFPPSYSLLILCGLMFISLLRCWMFPRSDQVVKPAKDSRYWIILFIATMTAYAYAKFSLHTSTGNRLIDIAHALVFALLVGQIVLVVLRRFDDVALLVFATVVTVTSFVCVSESITLYRQIAESAIAICLFALLSSLTMRSPSFVSVIVSNPWQRRTISAIFLALVVVISRPVASAMDVWLPSLQLHLSGAIEESIIEDYRASTLVGRYVDSASLNDVVEQYENDPEGIALRVYSEQSPGYLRGRAFDVYRDGRWIHHRNDRLTRIDELQALRPQVFTPDKSNLDMVATLPAERHDSVDVSRLNHFSFRTGLTGKKVMFEIENDPRRGEFFFLPLQASEILGVGRRLIVDPHGVVKAGLDTRHTYVTTVFQTSSVWELSPALREITLRLPLNLTQRFVQISNEICGDARTARLKGRQLSDHFQQNYRYSLDRREVTRNVDPILNFLATKHGAHCEYFASATVLLLRAQGIPARYVTGYVVSQRSEDEDYWLANNRNAHAWVEAYDDSSKRWFIIESTPGRTVPEFTFASNEVGARGGQSGEENGLGDGWFDLDWRPWRLLLAGQWSLALVELSEQMRWPLLVITLGLIYKVFRKQVSASRYAMDKHGEAYRKLLRSADRRVGYLGLHRSNSETIHAFAERIESVADASEVNRQYAKWYREFAELRYRSLSPDDLRPFPRDRK